MLKILLISPNEFLSRAICDVIEREHEIRIKSFDLKEKINFTEWDNISISFNVILFDICSYSVSIQEIIPLFSKRFPGIHLVFISPYRSLRVDKEVKAMGGFANVFVQNIQPDLNRVLDLVASHSKEN